MTEGDEFRGNRKNGTATPGAAGGQWRVIVDGGPPPSSEGVLLTGVEKDL